MYKIGCFGGTFDPIHNGHIEMAAAAMKAVKLDEVIFIPSGNSYQKNGVSPASYRYNLVREAIENIGWADLSPIEVDRPGPSYMVDTMKELKEAYEDEDTAIYLILGADAFLHIETWKDCQYLLENVNLIVVNRDENKEQIMKMRTRLGLKIDYVPFNYPMSSTEVRKYLKMKQYDKADVPEKVKEAIIKDNKYAFNAVQVKEHIVEWIRNKVNGFGEDWKCILGISGGKDSTVAAALCVEALGKERVWGILMPDGEQADIEDSWNVVELLGINNLCYNIGPVCDEMRKICDTVQARINLPPRIRMTTLYAFAQSIGKCFVVNTCNYSEDYVGYSTWHGDSAGDFSPLSQYTSEEVMEIGDACGLPHELTHKTPADGLCGKTDEDNLGFTYHELNEYIRYGIEPRPEIKAKIDRLHKANEFKLKPLDFCPYEE